jgi:hypothetical protein
LNSWIKSGITQGIPIDEFEEELVQEGNTPLYDGTLYDRVPRPLKSQKLITLRNSLYIG